MTTRIHLNPLRSAALLQNVEGEAEESIAERARHKLRLWVVRNRLSDVERQLAAEGLLKLRANGATTTGSLVAEGML